jgi:hypothetical protein
MGVDVAVEPVALPAVGLTITVIVIPSVLVSRRATAFARIVKASVAVGGCSPVCAAESDATNGSLML